MPGKSSKGIIANVYKIVWGSLSNLWKLIFSWVGDIFLLGNIWLHKISPKYITKYMPNYRCLGLEYLRYPNMTLRFILVENAYSWKIVLSPESGMQFVEK